MNKSKEKSSLITTEKLLECDFQLGHRLKFWNPKMKDFIHKKKGNRHIFDVHKSAFFLEKAYLYICDLVKAGADIMFVGVKNKVTSEIIEKAAQRVNAFYVTKRWLGGLLTNFKNISLNIKKLNDLSELLENPNLQEGYTKKEILNFSKQKDKFEKFYGGIKHLQKLPNLLVVFNPVEDHTAVKEAKALGIPIVALSNTNTDPDLVDFIIPGNNISTKSVYLIANFLCDAVAEVQGQSLQIAYKESSEIVIPEEYNYVSRTKSSERGNISLI